MAKSPHVVDIYPNNQETFSDDKILVVGSSSARIYAGFTMAIYSFTGWSLVFKVNVFSGLAFTL